MCIAKIAFNALFRPSKHLFTPKTPFAEKVMGPNFKHLYDTSSAASRLVKTWDKEIIPVNTFDSLTLEGWFYTAGENARDTAILVHGYNSSPLGDMSAIMQFYLRRGINVLLTNNRGGKTSVGNNITFGLYERLDTALWVDKLNERFDGGSIILHGISLGGATVCLMSEMLLKNVKCVVSDCAYTSIRAEFAHSSKLTMGFTPKATLERVYKLLQRIRQYRRRLHASQSGATRKISDTVYSRQGRPFYPCANGARTLQRLLLGQTPVPCGRRGTRRVVCKRPERVRIRRNGLCKRPQIKLNRITKKPRNPVAFFL